MNAVTNKTVKAHKQIIGIAKLGFTEDTMLTNLF